MSKSTKNLEWLNTRENSAKTLIARTKREEPKFKEHILKFEEQITTKCYAASAVFSNPIVIFGLCTSTIYKGH